MQLIIIKRKPAARRHFRLPASGEGEGGVGGLAENHLSNEQHWWSHIAIDEHYLVEGVLFPFVYFISSSVFLFGLPYPIPLTRSPLLFFSLATN